MDFGAAIQTCFRKYIDGHGRALRSEYWWFVLFVFVVQVVLRLAYAPLTYIFDLAIFLPHISVAVRRLHDTDRSGLWLLLAFIPIVGAIVLIVFFCQRGTPRENRFGLPPQAEMLPEET